MVSQLAMPFAFLLGSGVSLPAAPDTQLLTDLVLNRQHEFYLHTDERWYRFPLKGPSVTTTARIRQRQVQRLIENLASRVERYYSERKNPVGCPQRWCNYEDIGYLADALAGTLDRNRDDPGLSPLADQLCRELRCSKSVLLQTAMDTVAFVRNVVFLTLVDVRPPKGHLSLVIDAARDSDIEPLAIYTLNHDCMLEDIFEAEALSLFDFRRLDDAGRVMLDPGAEAPAGARAILYKPHGSVRWRRFRPMEMDDGEDVWSREWIGWDRDQAGVRQDEGVTWRSVGSPLILVGRFNKELDYTEAPYWQTFLGLARSLETRRQLVISGYGFADKAINTLLIDWLYARPTGERRLIVMHNDRGALLETARGAISSMLEEWIMRGQLRWIPRFPCNYSWEELKTILRERQ